MQTFKSRTMQPRIYTYKITFEEVPYYYYGVHKEKYFNDDYWGSPKTNKWCWELYTPKKQILQYFDFNDNGWVDAQEVEKRIIKPVYNQDKWCLNESCGGYFSLNTLSIGGQKGGERAKELGVGFFAMSEEEKFQARSKVGKSGVGGKKIKELGVGVCGLTLEQRRNLGLKTKELGVGICGLTIEERREISKITNSQRWECCETGYVSTAAGVVAYQKAKGINTSKNNRRRIA